MEKRGFCYVIVLLIIFLKLNLFAAIPVAVVQFEGQSPKKGEIETKVKEILGKVSGISVVADKMTDEIVKIQEKAQVLGSGYHDISKLKVAEFIVTGIISEGKLNIKAVAVNEGTEVYNQTIDIDGESSKTQLNKSVKEMSDRILYHGASRNEEIPSDAKPYMNLISQLASSLNGGDSLSYRYIAVYSKGAYVHPDSENAKSADAARRILKVMRQDLQKAKLYYLSMRGESFWVYIEVLAEKGAKKTKYRFGILELDDGTLAVCIYDEVK